MQDITRWFATRRWRSRARRDPDRLILTDSRGRAASLEAVMLAGVQGELRERVAALHEMMDLGPPEHRICAAAVLAAWGDPTAYGTIRAWIHQTTWPYLEPAFLPVPGSGHVQTRRPVPGPHHAPIADAIRIAGGLPPARSSFGDRISTMRLLLREYPSVDVGRSVADALVADELLTESVADAIGPAVDRSIAAIRDGRGRHDLPLQTASLLGPLALLSDARAAEAAEVLLAAAGPDGATATELARALRTGSGAATRDVLARLTDASAEPVRGAARAATAARPRETSYPRYFDIGGRLVTHVETAAGVESRVLDEHAGRIAPDATVLDVGRHDPGTAVEALSEPEYRARVAARRVDLLFAWAERLCTSTTNETQDLAVALGIEIAPPPLGAHGAGWETGYVRGLALSFPLEVIRYGDLTRRFGGGQELPRIHWDSPHVVAHDVDVAGAAWRVSVFAQSSEAPGPAVSVTSASLRVEPARRPTPIVPPPPPGEGIACATCGAMNARETAFCGTCGTFLEWTPRSG